MSDQSDPDQGAQPPETLHELHVRAPKTSAGGVPAIISSMRHALHEMGPVRTAQTLLRVNQKGGFDCVSCAWPDPDGERHTAEFCENGAKAVADEATTKRITPEFFAQHSLQQLAAQDDYWLNQQGRLSSPMLLRAGADHYAPVSWDAAFALIADELNALPSPDAAVFYTSGRTSNEAAFLYQLFVRAFGTNNLPDCSNMCHESSSVALSATIGIGKGTVKLEDFSLADTIVLIGQNPGTNHPRMLTALQEAKRAGATIISINPLPEAGLFRFKHPQEVSGVLGRGTALTDHFVQVRVGGDLALLKGLAKALLARPDALDQTFVTGRTSGYAAFAAELDALGWEPIVAESGVAQAEIEQVAEILARSPKIISCWAMGLTQQPQSVQTIQELVNIHLLRGAIGMPGAGLCPVRGHSNVQGDRTMGIWERPPAAFLDALEHEFGISAPRAIGYDVVEAIKAMHAGRVGVFFALGGNFLAAAPDTALTANALRRCRLTVQVSTKLNRSHLITGAQALILPCLGRTELDVQSSGPQFVSTENSMGVVQSSQGQLEPASEQLLSEPAICAHLAQATLGARSVIDWAGLAGDYDRIRAHIAQVVPGCADYNTRVRQPGGFYLHNGPREGQFPLPDDRAHFTASPLARHAVPDGHFVLITVRSHDQFNTTIYGRDDRYRGIYQERRVVLMHRHDIAAAGLTSGQLVDISSHFAGVTRTAHRFVVVAYQTPRGNVATYFPEANVLVPIDSVAAQSNTPTSKYVVVTIAPSAAS